MKAAAIAKSGAKREPETFDGKGNPLPPAPRAKVDLRDAGAIRRELGAVYRDMRAGRIETQEGTRLAYVLDLVRKAYETAILEQRVVQLERRNGNT